MELISGSLSLSLTDPSNTSLQIEDNVNNGDWHQLDVTINRESEFVLVELSIIGNNIGFLPIQQNVTLSPGTLVYGPVLLGSVTDLSSTGSYSGCMRMLYINEIAINLNINVSYDSSNAQMATPGCPREENCYPETCANGGECMSTWNDFSCSCSADFMGTDCSECKLFHHPLLYLLILSVAVAVSFSGNMSYVRYPVTERASNYFESGSIRIRTYDDNGIILHAGWQNDYPLSYHEYLVIEIVEGSLRTAAYSLNRGKYSTQCSLYYN